MQALMISAPHKSSGKTMIALGLARLLRRQGLKVQMFKKGPDYIDPIWHTHASGRPCYNLDFNTQTPAAMRALFRQKSRDADVVLVEGNHGLFDGQDIEGGDSNAALARLLGLQVMLVVDVTGYTRGLAPLLQGYAAFDPELKFHGVLLNKCAGQRHRQRLQAVCARYSPMPLLGSLLRWSEPPVKERHLGLQPANENGNADQVIDRFADWLATEMDVTAWQRGLPEIRATAPEPVRQAEGLGGGLRIGIVRDRAFGFYYPDDLEWMRDQGAKLVFIDALRDSHLPAVDGLFIGGGFPEMLAEDLAANESLRSEMRRHLSDGLPCYAECGGLMYLSRSIENAAGRWPMVGLLPASIRMQHAPVGRGLMRLRAEQHPWRLEPGMELRAHEFHHSRWRAEDGGRLRFGWKVLRGHGIEAGRDGVVVGNTVAGYAHLRHTEQFPWVDHFLRFVRESRQ